MSKWPTAPIIEGATPGVYALPPEPDGPVWDRQGDKWQRNIGVWQNVPKGTMRAWGELLQFHGPLAATPPKRTWRIGDTVSTPEEAETLPEETIIKAHDGSYGFRGTNGWLEPGFSDEIPGICFAYPLKIVWLPDARS